MTQVKQHGDSVFDWETITDEPIYYPAQCSCGHLIFERYCVKVDEKTVRPFVWCGFCRKRTDLGDRPGTIELRPTKEKETKG